MIQSLNSYGANIVVDNSCTIKTKVFAEEANGERNGSVEECLTRDRKAVG